MIRRLLAALNSRRTARLAAIDVAMVPRPTAAPDDLTALADVLAFDPPTTRLYVVPDAPTDMVLVMVGRRAVHRGCRDARTDGRPVRACCRPNLDKVTVAQW